MSGYVALTAESNTDEWLHLRKRGIGASEAAAVLGDSSWGTPLTVWQEKTSPEVHDIQNGRMLWGHRMEPIIAQYAAEDYPEQGQIIPSEGLLQSTEHPFLLATLDRNIVFPDGTVGPFEIKNVDAHEKYRWQGDLGLEVPRPYWIQTHVQMVVTGTRRAIVQPFFGGNDLPPGIVVDFDEAFAEEYIVGRLGDFWHFNVETRTPPEASLGDDLWAIWPGVQGQVIEATDEIRDVVGMWRIDSADAKAATDSRKEHQLTIAKFMGDATELVDPWTGHTIHTLRPRVDGVRIHKATKAEI